MAVQIPHQQKRRRLWRGIMIVAVIGFGVGCVASLILTRWVAMSLTHPQRGTVSDLPASWAATGWEDVSFTTVDGLTLRGWFIPPSDAPGPALVLTHGIGDTRLGWSNMIAPLYDDGYGLLIYDLRNHGESDGTITTLGYHETEDVLAALRYVRGRPEVDTDRVALMGHSLGSAAVLHAAASTDEYAAVVVFSAFTSLEDNVADGLHAFFLIPAFPFAPMVIFWGEQETGISLSELRPIEDVANIAPRPVLFVHGASDHVLPAHNSARLWDAANDPKEMIIVPGMGHGSIQTAPPSMVADVLAFLQDALN